MGKVKRIALITSASNFERYKKVVKAVDKKLKELGGYALYVFACYGLFEESKPYDKGEASIYSLIEEGSFDGCILEGNIGHRAMLESIAGLLQKKEIPFVTLGFGMEGIPFFVMDSYNTGRQLMEHLVKEHHCSKINIALTLDDDIFGELTLKSYCDVLTEQGIPVEDKRIVRQNVSIKNGRALYQIFKDRGIDDAEAFICIHDVFGIGLCLEMQEQGLQVPDDLKICSLNRSINSIVFRPDMAGADRGDTKTAKLACEGLEKLINGEEIPLENYATGRIFYGESCGCSKQQNVPQKEMYQELIVGKIEAGTQISQMMQYNDSLEEVHSLNELGENVKNMINGISCKEFIFCLNQQAMQYISNETEELCYTEGKCFDDTMMALVGYTERTGELRDYPFAVKDLLPMEPREGDIMLFLPVHHKEKPYGYIVFVNETLPIEMYNYRICHESLGSSMENLHREMILRRSITALEELHMQDALTGIYNRFAWNRFLPKYVETGKYCVIMVDMDGLKKINDNFGHLAGNHAINVTVDAIKNALHRDDLLIRYGGDEFQILSYNTSRGHWENIHRMINEKLEAECEHQKLPYALGVSLGCCSCDEEHPLTVEECCERADRVMYENKKARKAERVD